MPRVQQQARPERHAMWLKCVDTVTDGALFVPHTAITGVAFDNAIAPTGCTLQFAVETAGQGNTTQPVAFDVTAQDDVDTLWVAFNALWAIEIEGTSGT